MTSARLESSPAPSSETAAPPAGLPSHGFMSPEYIPSLVSVIVPTYNRRQLVLEALESVVAQTFRPIELLVVDDGSTDGTLEAIEAWWDELPRERAAGIDLRLLRQENAGAQRARNRGLEACRGEFIQFLDSDDLLHPEKLERHVTRLREDPRLQYVYSPLTRFETVPDWDRPESKRPLESLDVHEILGVYRLNTAAGVYRRALCVSIGPWNEALRVSQDTEYHLRMLLTTRDIELAPGVGMAHRRHSGERISAVAPASRLQSVDAIEALLSEAGRLDHRVRRALAPRYFRIGLAAACQGDIDTARRAARRGLGCPCSLSRRLKLVLLAILCAKGFPRPLGRVLSNRMMALARRHA